MWHFYLRQPRRSHWDFHCVCNQSLRNPQWAPRLGLAVTSALDVDKEKVQWRFQYRDYVCLNSKFFDYIIRISRSALRRLPAVPDSSLGLNGVAQYFWLVSNGLHRLGIISHLPLFFHLVSAVRVNLLPSISYLSLTASCSKCNGRRRMDSCFCQGKSTRVQSQSHGEDGACHRLSPGTVQREHCQHSILQFFGSLLARWTSCRYL